MNPFTDPALGALPRDTRLFYLGLLELHTRYGDRTPADAIFLKAELFRYDEDVTTRDITRMTETLTNKGKIHIVSGDVVLSDPQPVTTRGELDLFGFTTTRTNNKPTTVQDQAFEDFWSVYPRRNGKGAARKAFLAQTARGVSAAEIVVAAGAYAQRCRQIGKEAQFIPYPATWLNQERWEDDEEQAPQVRSRMDDAMRSGMDLVSFYQQQEVSGPTTPKELGW